MPRFLLLLILVVAPAGTAAAADIHLSWDDCGAAGAGYKAFACNTNFGGDVLVGSFIPPSGMDHWIGVDATMFVYFPQALPMPSWWDFNGCRTGGLSATTDFSTGPFTCADPLGPSSASGFAWDQPAPWIGRLRVAAAIPFAHPVSPDSEYYAFKVNLRRAKTVGTGACTGCDVPAGIYLRGMKLAQEAGWPTVELTPIDRADHRYYANWQCDGAPLIEWDTGAVIGWTFDGSCVVPARSPTWGAIKSLYR